MLVNPRSVCEKIKHHDFEEPEEWEQPVADEQVPGHMLWEGLEC